MSKKLLARTTAVVGTAVALAAGIALSVQAHADETTATADVVKIDAGGDGVEDFVSDAAFVNDGLKEDANGQNANRNNACMVTHKIPNRAWDTFRTGAQKYTINDLPKGGYQVRLYFLDFKQARTGDRVFDVKINGTSNQGFPAFDISRTLAEHGQDGAFQGVELVQQARTDADGSITIELLNGSAGEPIINAISVVEAGKASVEDSNLPAKPPFCR